MAQEYQYLFRNIPEEEKAAIQAMDEGGKGHRMLELGTAWQKKEDRLIRARLDGEDALKAKKPGAFRKLMELMPDALYSAQLQAFIQVSYGRAPSINIFLGGLKQLGKALKKVEDNKDEAFLSRDFRDFLEKEQKYQSVRQKNMKDLILTPVVFAAIWLGLYLLFSAPFMAGVLAWKIWDTLTLAALCIISLGLALFLWMGFQLGFILSIVAGVFITALVAWGGMNLFRLVLNLTPAVAANFADLPAETLMLFFCLWLVLVLITLIFVAGNVSANWGAWNKEADLKSAWQELAPLLPRVEEEAQFYGLALEMADLCLDRIRQGNGEKELRFYTKEEAVEIAEQVQQYFRPICGRYEALQKAIKA